jgi:hypothetical protein
VPGKRADPHVECVLTQHMCTAVRSTPSNCLALLPLALISLCRSDRVAPAPPATGRQAAGRQADSGCEQQHISLCSACGAAGLSSITHAGTASPGGTTPGSARLHGFWCMIPMIPHMQLVGQRRLQLQRH